VWLSPRSLPAPINFFQNKMKLKEKLRKNYRSNLLNKSLKEDNYQKSKQDIKIVNDTFDAISILKNYYKKLIEP
jgi:hypothetical protein